jgi:hypothetical protein
MSELKEHFSKKRFTDDQIRQANSVNIIEYAKSRGYDIKRISARSYKISGHGGLYIDSSGLKWNCFSADTGGGTIQFVMYMENKSWVEAIKQLLNLPEEYSHTPKGNRTRPIIKDPPKPELILPEKSDTYKNVLAYLIGTRKLDKNLVYDLIKQNKIYQSKNYNNCVFVGYDEHGKARYGAVRSSNSKFSYKNDCTGSDKRYAFSVVFHDSKISDGKGIEIQRLCVFESPIDLISYLSLLNRFQMKTEPILCISLGGVCDSALKTTLANSPDIIQIVMTLDNDAAGNSACEQIAQSNGDKYTLIRCLPQHKDFNEDLVASINESEPLNNVVQELEEDDSYELHT